MSVPSIDVVARGLGEPHRLGFAPEPTPKIGETPAHLRDAIARVAEGEDRVVVSLRDGVAVTVVARGAQAVGFDDALVGYGIVVFHPREQRRTEVEADVLEVVDRPARCARSVSKMRAEGVGAVTLVVNALVPVVEGVHLGLALDDARPRILARRLIEMSVDDGFEHGGLQEEGDRSARA